VRDGGCDSTAGAANDASAGADPDIASDTAGVIG
jgi:hypothetical protein